jgi:alpha-1,6-mannosyltransferase
MDRMNALRLGTDLLWLGLLLLGAVVMVPFGSLHTLGHVPVFLLGAAVMLLGFYGTLVRPVRHVALIFGGAVAVRALLIFQEPGGDIFRYIWEGRMVLAGVNPYLHPPNAPGLEGLQTGLWAAIEHKSFTAIYPPLAQGVFALLAAISPSVAFFKIAFAAADLAAGVLLARRYGWTAAVVFLWNPMVLYAFAGGGHYDSLFVLALVLAWCDWEARHLRRAVVWLGAAVALKWVALPVLGWALWRMLRERGFATSVGAAALSVLPLAVSWLALSAWTGEWTVRLYPEKFTAFARSTEFVPRIVAWFWEDSQFRNSLFAPPLALAWAAGILLVARFARVAEWSFFAALVLSPMVHAWYFTWLVPFAVATRNAGTLAVTATSFGYYIVYHRLHARPDLGWMFFSWEIALIWLPFVAGFLWTIFRRPRP